MNSPEIVNIPDVQSSPDKRHLAIDKVGIKSIRHPIKVADKSAGVQHTIATFNMYVELPHNFKGTHMSRFVEILNTHEREISVESFESILREMVAKLESDSGYIEMSFPYFMEKSAPVSGVKSLSLTQKTLQTMDCFLKKRTNSLTSSIKPSSNIPPTRQLFRAPGMQVF